MPDPAFRSLFADTENTGWDSMNRIRARARRRTAGQAAAVAGIVAVALVSGGIAVAQVRQGPVTPPVATPSPSTSSAPSRPAPSPSAASPAVSASPSTPATAPSSPKPVPPDAGTGSSSPPVTGITSAMMLRPQDVGSGYTVVTPSDGDWTFEFSASVLGCPRGSRPDPVAERERALRKGAPQDEDFVLQHTGRYARGEAARYLDDVRERVSSCPPDGQRSVRVAADGFAGDEAVLVVFDLGDGFLARTVLVRKGDVLTEIFGKPARSDSASRALGRKAAARF